MKLHLQERTENGSFTVFVVIVAVALMLLIGLVVDAGRALSDRTYARSYAEEAARAGADQLSVDDLRAGQVAIDPELAIRAADTYLSSIGQPGWASASEDEVTVHVETNVPTVILGMIHINRIGISVSASATNVHGVARGD